MKVALFVRYTKLQLSSDMRKSLFVYAPLLCSIHYILYARAKDSNRNEVEKREKVENIDDKSHFSCFFCSVSYFFYNFAPDLEIQT